MDYEKAAEVCDDIAAAYGKLANIFRSASGEGADGDAEASPASAKRTSKRAAAADTKPTSKKKAAAAEEDLTIDDVRVVLKELVDTKGKDVMVQALESVGAGKLADVDESQYGELVEEAKRLMDEEEPDEAPAPKTRSRSKAKAKKGPTADDVMEKFKELLEADRAQAKAVLKKLKVAKISEVEEDDLADALAAVEAALEGEAEEDLL